MTRFLSILLCLFLAGPMWAANSFDDAIAVWLLENGVTDSSGNGNTLTNTGVTFSATSKQGSYSGDFELSESDKLSIADAILSAGFPFKVGDTRKQFSVAFWFRAESTTATQYLVSKYDSTNDKRTIAVALLNDNRIVIIMGYNSGASYEADATVQTITDATWYHLTFTYRDDSRTWTLYVQNEALAVVVNTTGTADNALNIEDAAFVIGSAATGTPYFDGLIDEVVVWNRIIDDSEAAQIAAGTYSGGYATGTIYVAPTATNDGSGDDENNCRALGSASWAEPNDTIILIPGSYGAVTLACVGTAGLEVTLQAQSALTADFTQIIATSACDYTIIDGVEVTGGTAVCVQLAGNVTIQNSSIHSTITDGAIVNQTYGVLVSGEGPTIDNCDIYYTFIGVQFGASGTLKNSHIHDTASSIVRLLYEQGTASVQVLNNHIHNHRNSWSWTPEPHGSGLSIKGDGISAANPTIVRGNFVYNAATTLLASTYSGQVANGYDPNGYKHIIFEDNVLQSGKTYDLNEPDTYNSYVKFFDWGEGCILRNNTFGCGVQLFFSNPNYSTPGLDSYLTNNLFLADATFCGYYTQGLADYRNRSSAAQEALIDEAVANGLVEGGNIASVIQVYWGTTTRTADVNGTSYDWTTFWAGSASVENATDSYWAAAAGGMFADNAKKEGFSPYRLRAGCPAIDAALTTDANCYSTEDRWGNARGGSPDIGAYEYGAGTTVAALTSPSPADTATGVAISSGISWTPDDTNAVYYDVYFGTSATPDFDEYQSYTYAGLVPYEVNSVAVTDLADANLGYDQTYYWRVDQISADGYVTVGDVYSFTTLSATPPEMNVPTGLSPSEATGQRTALTLSWTAVTGATGYTLTFSDDGSWGDADDVEVSQAGTSYAVTRLEPGHTYYWRVKATNAGEGTETAWTQTWFTVESHTVNRARKAIFAQ